MAEPAASHDDPLYVPRLVATAAYVVATSAVRTAGSWLKLCSDRVGTLAKLSRQTTSGDAAAATSRAVLRDEVLDLGREMAEVWWRQARWALEAFDEHTGSALRSGERAHARQHRVKS